MEWLNWYLPEPSIHFQWYMVVPFLLGYVLLPLTAFFFLAFFYFSFLLCV